MSDLFAIVQKSGETMDDLIYRINVTTDKSCNLTDTVIELCKISALCNAVKDQSIQTELRKTENLNWKDAVEIVQIMDKPVKSCDHEVNFVSNHRDSDEPVRRATRLESSGVRRGSESTRGPRDLQLNEREFFKPLHCYVCGKRNHKAKHCHHRFQNRFNNGQNRSVSRHQSNYRDHSRSTYRNSRPFGHRPMRNKGHECTDQINGRLAERYSYNRNNSSSYNRFEILDNDCNPNLYGYPDDQIQNTASLNC